MWKNLSLSHLDPYSSTCEQEVQKIIHLQKIANQMPDAFIDLKRITKSHIPAENVPIRIDVPKGPSTSVIANESKKHCVVDHWGLRIKILEKERLNVKMTL